MTNLATEAKDLAIAQLTIRLEEETKRNQESSTRETDLQARTGKMNRKEQDRGFEAGLVEIFSLMFSSYLDSNYS